MISLLRNGIASGDILGTILSVLAMLIAITIAITAHEWAHGFVAYLNGDATAKVAGRLSLNPIKHFDLIGFLMLLLVGFGWAKPVPINPNNFKNYKKGLFTVSIAGVSMNLILAIVCMCLVTAVQAIIIATAATGALLVFLNFLFTIFLYACIINLTLMAFNLLPIYPLDGFRVIETFAKYDNRYCMFMRRYGQYVLLGLLLISNILGSYFYFLDIIGMYIAQITGVAMKLLNLMLGLV